MVFSLCHFKHDSRKITQASLPPVLSFSSCPLHAVCLSPSLPFCFLALLLSLPFSWLVSMGNHWWLFWASFELLRSQWSWCLCWSLVIVIQNSQDVLNPQLLPVCWERPFVQLFKFFFVRKANGYESLSYETVTTVRGCLGFEPTSHHLINKAYLPALTLL